MTSTGLGGMDDFDEFDEDGIYREKSLHDTSGSDNGILVDEDGIWRDDYDHQSHFSYRTYNTDSGIGVDKKSSSSTINRHHEADLDSYGTPLAKQGGYDDYREDEKSLNISELEASESGHGDLSPYEAHSFDSDEEVLDFPELHDESYQITSTASDRSKAKESGDSKNTSKDGENEVFYGSSERFASEYGSNGRNSKPDQSELAYYDNDALRYLIGETSVLSEKEAVPEEKERASDSETGSPIATATDTTKPKLPLPVVGDSIFTQPDEQLSINDNRHSLIEFEQFEHLMETFQEDGENLDLIGAYLKGLKDQEEAEDKLKTLDPIEESDVRPRKYDQELAEEEMTRSEAANHSFDSQSIDEVMLVPKIPEGEEGLYYREDSSMQQYSDDDTSREYENSLPYDDVLITEQKPPFGTVDSEVLDPPDSARSMKRPPTPTRIPMLRSRSPSMSRPGSSLDVNNRSLTNSRSNTPGTGMRYMSPLGISPERFNRRALPTTPGSKGQGHHILPKPPVNRNRSQSPPKSFRSLSPPKSARSQRSQSPPKSARSRSHSPDQTLMTQDSSVDQSQDIDLAATLLLTEDSTGNRTQETVIHKSSLKSRSSIDEVKSSPRPSSDSRQSPSRQTPSPRQVPKPVKSKKKPSLKAMPDFMSLTQSSFEESEDDSPSKVKLKQKFLEEHHERKQKEEHIQALSSEYNTLLKKYAEAENVIDDLRLGAKMNLYGDPPPSGQATTGSLGGSQHGQTFTLGTMGTAQMGSMSAPQQAVLGGTAGSRPLSRNSNLETSSTGMITSPLPTSNGNQLNMVHELDNSLAEDSVKLSLLMKTKAVEEQTNAFKILLDENHLSLDDQEKALQNIREGYDGLQGSYRDARDEYNLMRRQGKLKDESSVFDENKELEGEIYKLGMKLDDFEHQVEGNLKQKSNRVPFQGNPMKGDHSIKLNGTQEDKSPLCTSEEKLSPRRPPSLGSITGGADIDEQLHKLNKDYNTLMDRYRRLKQMKRTPDRDEEVQRLLVNLKDIYEKTPDHRKPALPPELESQYNAADGSFVDPQQKARVPDLQEYLTQSLPRSPRSPYKSTRRRDDSSTTETDRGSTPQKKERRTRMNISRDSSDPNSSRSGRSREKLDPREEYRRRKADSSRSSDRSFDSMTSGSRPSLRSESSGQRSQSSSGRRSQSSGRRSELSGRRPESRERQLPKPGVPNRGRRGDRDDKDSGYVGSEAGRKLANQKPGRGVSSGMGTGTGSYPSKASALSRSRSLSMGSEDEDSEVSDSGSADSVIERKIAAKPGSKSLSRSAADDGRRTPSAETTDRHGRSRDSHVPESKVSSRSRPRSRSRRRQLSDSDGSQHSARSGSTKSDQIVHLQDDVNRLKAQLGMAAQPPAMVAVQTPMGQVLTPQRVAVPSQAPHVIPPQHQQQYQAPPPQNYYQQHQQLVPPQMQHGPAHYAPPIGKENMDPSYHRGGRRNSFGSYGGYSSRQAAEPYHDDYYDDRGRAYDEYDYKPGQSSRSADGDYNRPLSYREQRYRENEKEYEQDYDRDSRYDHDSYPGSRYRDYHRDPDRTRPKYYDERDGYYSDNEPPQRGRHRDKYSKLRDYYVPPGETYTRDGGGGGYYGESYPQNGYGGQYVPPTHQSNYPPAETPYVNGYSDPQYSSQYPQTIPQQQVGSANYPSYAAPAVTPQFQQPISTGVTQPIYQPQTIPTDVTQTQQYQTIPAGVAQTQYQTVPTGVASNQCPMCGSGAYHTHGDYTYQPAANQTVIVPNNANASFVQPAAHTTSNCIPVHIIPAEDTPKKDPKVRYYVREYGSSKPKKSTRVYIDSDTEEEHGDTDLNDSINEALKTARKLKKKSTSMRNSLKDELSISSQFY